eukprot:TRINITY_DN18060_c0_g2_i2.p1 TRINITY_DN18060_c0_g2~~TRINITY_DN18060_c0_g2_i2.p1  ORF type:complete len:555 (+),score=76.15 TRINITY_DN18060_c0_g2_i2:40-1665(+)
MADARPSVSNLARDEDPAERQSLREVQASPSEPSDAISIGSIDVNPPTKVRPDTLGASVVEGHIKAEPPSGFLDQNERASRTSQRSSIAPKQSSSFVNEEGKLERMKSYDSKLDIAGKEAVRCPVLQKINGWLDALPFPCGIRPVPCLRRKGCCNRFCEANRCCFFLARQGILFMGYLRKLVLLVSVFFTSMSILLRGLPAAALGSDQASLEGYPWAYGKYVCMKPETCRDLDARVMIGLTSLLVISDNLNIRNSIEWGADNCVDQLGTLGAGSYCEICRDASLGCAAVALISIVTGFVNFFADIQRMRARNDHNCIKNLAVLSNIVGALQQLFAVSIFHGLCVAEFPREDADQNFRLELQMGSGGALLASAVALNLFGIVSHLLIPVPEARWRVYGKISEPDPAMGEWPPLREETSVTTMAGEAVRTKSQLSESQVVGSGPGWENDGQMMTPVPRATARDIIRPASERMADILSIDNASRGSESSIGSQGSKRSFLSRLSGSLSSSPKNRQRPSTDGVDAPAEMPNEMPLSRSVSKQFGA